MLTTASALLVWVWVWAWVGASTSWSSCLIVSRVIAAVFFLKEPFSGERPKREKRESLNPPWPTQAHSFTTPPMVKMAV
ncbi:MAG: hypothetical protein BYD32DRAFT_411287 [Podila humilis]|nr:MAG: hypothetical protein BYD32DRAFT_411287 [Podila humilis]